MKKIKQRVTELEKEIAELKVQISTQPESNLDTIIQLSQQILVVDRKLSFVLAILAEHLGLDKNQLGSLIVQDVSVSKLSLKNSMSWDESDKIVIGKKEWYGNIVMGNELVCVKCKNKTNLARTVLRIDLPENVEIAYQCDCGSIFVARTARTRKVLGSI